MKKTIILLALICFIVPSFGQSVSEEETVKKTLQDVFEDVFSGLDTNAIKKYLTDNFVLLENGKVWNNDTIRKFITKEALPKVEKLKIENHRFERTNKLNFIKISIQGNTAWTAYWNDGVFKVDDKVVNAVHWLESAVLVKTPSGWKIQLLHSTVIDKEPPKPENK